MITFTFLFAFDTLSYHSISASVPSGHQWSFSNLCTIPLVHDSSLPVQAYSLPVLASSPLQPPSRRVPLGEQGGPFTVKLHDQNLLA